MSTHLVYLNSPNGIHNTYGLSILTHDKSTAENFLHVEIPFILNIVPVQYFIQGCNINEYSVCWVYVEFFDSDDKIIQFLQEFNKFFGGNYYGFEIQMDEPAKEFMTEHDLF